MPAMRLSIQYPGRPELASKDVIGPDGRITLPLAGPIEVANLTREAAAQKIGVALSAYYTNLTATVEVMKYGSNHVTLLGDVKKPWAHQFRPDADSAGGAFQGRHRSSP